MANDTQDEIKTTPSRISVAALMSPAQSPRPSANVTRTNSPELNGNRTSGRLSSKREEEDQSNKVINLDEDDDDVQFVDAVDASPGTLASRINPARKAKSVATEETAEEMQATAGQVDEDEEEEGDENFGEVEGEEEDDDEDDDEEDDDEDDDDDDDEDSSDEGSGDEKSEMEGNEKANGDVSMQDTNGDQAATKQTNGDADVQDDVSMTDATKEKGDSGKKGNKGIMKKKMKRRSPSVEALPIGPPPRPTVRIKITLAKNDDESYLTNVPDEIYKSLEGKDHVWSKWYESTLPNEEEPEDDENENGTETDAMPDTNELGGLARLLAKYPVQAPSGKGKGKGKGKKSDMDYGIGEYDTKDPFVDDSELNVDEPTYSAKPSADGFFVVEGEIELQEVERNKLEATREEMLANAGKRGQMPPGFGQIDPGPDGTDAGGAGAVFLELGAEVSNSAVINTMLSRYADEFNIAPLTESEKEEESTLNGAEEAQDGDAKAGEEDGERPPPFQPIQPVKYPVRPVPRRLEKEFIHLRQLAAKESWLKKSKFPPDLRAPLVHAGMVAISLNEFNENFFNWLPQIFPYNRHTLHKYVRRQIHDDHTSLMKKLMDMQEAGMKRQVGAIHADLIKSFDEAMEAWNARGSREATPAGDNTAEKERQAAEEAAIEKELAEGEGGGDEDEDGANIPINKNAKPVKRWLWTEPLRETLFTIMTIDNAMRELKSEKNELENVNEKTSVINARKVIYKRLIELWPEQGLTTTTALSNQYGLYKRKVDKFAQMLHGNLPASSNGIVIS